MLHHWSIPGLVLLTAAAVYSVDARLTAGAADTARAEARASVSGLRVVMNPATGEIVGQPTADQLGRRDGPPGLAERRRARDLRRFDLPHGAQGVELDGWADHTTRVERGADGGLRVVCSQGDTHGASR